MLDLIRRADDKFKMRKSIYNKENKNPLQNTPFGKMKAEESIH